MFGVAGGQNLLLDVGGNADRDRKRQTLVAAIAAVDLRVDADHLAARIEQRPAGVAGVHGNVGLNKGHKVVVRQRTALGADDTGRHGVLEAKG